MKIVAFDIETTGFCPDKNKIIEIGAVKHDNKKLVGQFKLFIRIDEKLNDKIINLTGINDYMLESEGLPLKNVLCDFSKFISDAEALVAHNSKFDVKFINSNFKRENIETKEKKVFCTMEIEKELDTEKFGKSKREGYKLANLTEKYNIKYENAHRALNDAEMTIKLLYEQGIEAKKIGYKSKKSHSIINEIVVQSYQQNFLDDAYIK